MDMLYYIIFTVIIFVPHMVGAVAGFGTTVLGIPLLSFIMPFEKAKLFLICYVSIAVLSIAIKHYKHINRREALKMILISLCGVPIGIYSFERLPQQLLMIALACFVLFSSAWGLLRTYKLIPTPAKPPRGLEGLLFIGGIIQGAFASSGPIMVIYTNAKIKDKASFRATQCCMWTVLNATIIGTYFFNGTIYQIVSDWALFVWGFLVMIIATIIGNIMHHRIHQSVFTKLIYCILLLVGLIILYNNTIR